MTRIDELRRRKPIDQIVRGILERREELIWRGQPVPAYAFWSCVNGNSWLARFFLLAVGLVAIQPFSIAGWYAVRVSGASLLSPSGPGALAGSCAMLLLGLLLALGPYYLAFSRGIHAYWNAGDTHYVITSRRAMILLIRQGRIVEEHAIQIAQLPEPRLKMLLSNGIGDVIYAAGGEYSGSENYSTHYDIGFQGVPEAQEVKQILEQAIRSSRQGRTKRTQSA